MSSEVLMQNLEKKFQEKLQQQKESLNLLIKQKEEDFIKQMSQYHEKYRQNLLTKITSEDVLLKNKLLIDYRTELSTRQEKAIDNVLKSAMDTVIDQLENSIEIREHYYNKLLRQLLKDFSNIKTIECPINAFNIIKEFISSHKSVIEISIRTELKAGLIAYQSNEGTTIYYTLDADIERMEIELRNQIAETLCITDKKDEN